MHNKTSLAKSNYSQLSYTRVMQIIDFIGYLGVQFLKNLSCIFGDTEFVLRVTPVSLTTPLWSS